MDKAEYIRYCLAERISMLRTEQNMTQKQLAEELGVSRSLVASWETGVREPNAIECLRLADLFFVTSDYLCGRINERKNIPPFHFQSINGEIITDTQYKKALEVYFELLEMARNRKE